MRHPDRSLLALLLIFVMLTPSRTLAGPADWLESDWAKFIELSITVALSKVYEGLKVPASMRTSTPVGGKFPMLDAYSALSATGSSVKPGLTVWLQAKMREAADAGDYERLNGYQAYYTALTTGEKAPLEALQRRAQANLDKAERAKKEQALILNDVVAVAGAGGEVEVVPQFTVKGNQEGKIKQVSYRYTLRGPEVSFWDRGVLALHQPRGYQAGKFVTQLPSNCPSGRYTVGVSLSDLRGLSTDTVKAHFNYTAKPKPSSDEPEGPPEPEPPEPPQEEGPEPNPEPPELSIDPDSNPPAPGPFTVSIEGPRKGSVGDKLSFSALLEGEPVEPVDYTWKVRGRSIPKRAITGTFDREGWHTVSLTARDSNGRTVSSTVRVEVAEPEQLRVQVSGPSRAKVGRVVQLSCKVSGGKPPYEYDWRTDGKRWATEQVTLDYDTPGEHSAQLRVTDRRGTQGRGSLTIQVEGGLAVNVEGPRRLRVGQSATYVPIVVTGPPTGYSYSWQTESSARRGASFTTSYDSPGRKTLILTAEHPDFPVYRSKAFVEVEPADQPSDPTTGRPLSVRISGPTEANPGDKVTFSPLVQGGTPPFRFRWTVKGKTVGKETIQGRFEESGRHSLKLEVYDSGEHSERPKVTHRTLTVEPEESSTLRVGIRGPAKLEVGQKGTYTPKVQGGIAPYRYLWTVKDRSIPKKTIAGKFEQPGVQNLTLAVYDSGQHRERPVRVSSKVTVSEKNSSARPVGPVNTGPVKTMEFIGTYTMRSSDSAIPFMYPITFMANGETAQVREGGRLVNKAYFSLQNGRLSVLKSNTSDFFKRNEDGPLTRMRYNDGRVYYVWDRTNLRNGKRDKITFTPVKR